ncbi:MAG: S-layer homology domain-containing protein [Candidatus Gracilibacteria bacterium]|nr:S-layer homology domain-containing protein [Candidatus Gracilibacteria bacterium]
MKIIHLFLSLALITLSIAPAFAIDISELSYREIAPGWNDLYGRITTLELYPSEQNLDETVELEFSLENLTLPQNIYYDHLGVFHWEESLGFDYEFSGGQSDGKKMTVQVTRTGQYFLAPIVPTKTIKLIANQNQTTLGQTINISSETILSNNGQTIWDGFPFQVSVSNGKTPQGVVTKNGKISFDITTEQPGSMIVSIATEFGEEGSTGNINIEVADSTIFVSPPSQVSIEGKTLNWLPSDDTDIIGYLINYRIKGSTKWNGVDYNTAPSPIDIPASLKNYQLTFSSLDDLNYEIMLTAIDSSGNESTPSNIVSYQVPLIDYNNFQEDIQRNVQELEEKEKELLSATKNTQPTQSTTPSNLSEPKTPMTFPDIQNHWAKEYIEQLADKGVINGYVDGNFGPDDAVTRAQLVKIALNAFDYELSEASTAPFKDISVNDWHAPFITTAKKFNVLNGYSDGTFKPSQLVNRAEGLKILLNSGNMDTSTAETSDFEDVDDNQWYSRFVAFATANNMISSRKQSVSTSNSDLAGQTIVIDKILWQGKTGENVKKLQTALNILGYFNGEITGEYDSQTTRAVYDFQIAEKIISSSFDPSRNGSLGKTTKSILNSKKIQIPSNNQSSTEDNKQLHFFDPTTPLTRAEVAKIAIRILDIKNE